MNPGTEKAGFQIIDLPNSHPWNPIHKAAKAVSKKPLKSEPAELQKNRANSFSAQSKQKCARCWRGRRRGFAFHGPALTPLFENQDPGVFSKITYHLPGWFRKEPISPGRREPTFAPISCTFHLGRKRGALWRSHCQCGADFYTMSKNNLVKTIMDITTLTGLAVSISWILRKMVKENFTSDHSHELCKVHRCHGW